MKNTTAEVEVLFNDDFEFSHVTSTALSRHRARGEDLCAAQLEKKMFLFGSAKCRRAKMLTRKRNCASSVVAKLPLLCSNAEKMSRDVDDVENFDRRQLEILADDVQQQVAVASRAKDARRIFGASCARRKSFKENTSCMPRCSEMITAAPRAAAGWALFTAQRAADKMRHARRHRKNAHASRPFAVPCTIFNVAPATPMTDDISRCCTRDALP